MAKPGQVDTLTASVLPMPIPITPVSEPSPVAPTVLLPGVEAGHTAQLKRRGRRSGSSAADLLDQLATTAHARLRVLALLGLGGFLVGAVLASILPPLLGRPGHVTAVLASLCGFLSLVSAAVWWLAGRLGASSRRVITLGLGYVWLSGTAMAAAEVAIAPTGDAYDGVPGLCIWIVLFPLIIPCLPRHALTTGLACAAALPGAYGLGLLLGNQPAPTGMLVGWFAPPFFCTGLAFAAAMAVNSLTGELVAARRAVRELGAYTLERRLGVGGMGEVWLARHRLLPRSAAVKFVRPQMVARSGGDNEFVRRFEREARSIALLRSPHTVQLYDFGVTAVGQLYYAMELLDGFDLDALVRRHGRQSESRVAAILAQVCLSLMEAHARGLVHRDLSPRNLMLVRLGAEVDVVKVLDFGLVGVVTPQAPATGDTRLTTLVGTPGFIAPEVLAGGQADARSDLYSLGAVAYWLLTGSTMFPIDATAEDLTAHREARVVPPSARLDAVLHEGLEELVLTCVQKRPDQRPQSAADLRTALLGLRFDPPWDETRARLWWAEHAPGGAAT